MRHESQRGPLWEVYCKMGQRWQVHHTLLNPVVLDKLEINTPKKMLIQRNHLTSVMQED